MNVFNYSTTVSMYWGTFAISKALQLYETLKCQKCIPNVEVRMSLILDVSSVLGEHPSLCYLAAKTKFNWEHFYQCDWINSASEMKVLYLSVVCEKIKLCSMK